MAEVKCFVQAFHKQLTTRVDAHLASDDGGSRALWNLLQALYIGVRAAVGIAVHGG